MRALIEYGASLMALSHALCEAVEHNKMEVATLLLDSGAGLNVYVPEYNGSPWIL